MLKKICRCGKVIPYSMKVCDECKSKVELERKQNIKYYKQTTYERDSKYNKFYKSKEWNKVRQLAIVRDHALCKDCLDNNVITPYNTVHHIVPIKEDWSRRLDINNLICLCESCHQKRHSSMKG
ncbi:HNH endonuclease signature motif containing protein [Clostridium sp.]|uniref:HNH endonuclease n=1 Tax=Clostridium sp. TaxID=1506 RepID=UPI00290B2A6F|nr:HNH endonuclease signature motif containing protein [Clostridium sp.]MDU3526741.1 HNH endonuclease signature motif containing protein [Clostridium sp.]